MKNLAVILGAAFTLTTSALHAIEGLTVTKQGGNAVLSWPSKTNDIFIIQKRVAFDTNQWITLTNGYPAA